MHTVIIDITIMLKIIILTEIANFFLFSIWYFFKLSPLHSDKFQKNGASSRNRTGDPSLTMAVLYLLSYRSIYKSKSFFFDYSVLFIWYFFNCFFTNSLNRIINRFYRSFQSFRNLNITLPLHIKIQYLFFKTT